MSNLIPLRISLYVCCAAIGCLSCIHCYSFSGATVPQHWTSISITLFEDESGYGQPALREKVTNMLIEKFQRDNTLPLRDGSTAAVEMLGTITAVEADQPIAVAQGTQAARLQVTLHLSVTLMDRVKGKQVWKKTFTATGDYAPSGGISEREAGLAKALEKVTDDILLETISGW
ncbi:MAG: LptE family protein [Bacteroidota bacterium]|nr:LptE family protein [Bacteroidota bacterium]